MRTVMAWPRMLKSAGLSRTTVSAVLHAAGAAPSIDLVSTSVGAAVTPAPVLDGGGVSGRDEERTGDGLGTAVGLGEGDAKILPGMGAVTGTAVDSAPAAGGTAVAAGAMMTEPLVIGMDDTGGGTAGAATTGVATTGVA